MLNQRNHHLAMLPEKVQRTLLHLANKECMVKESTRIVEKLGCHAVDTGRYYIRNGFSCITRMDRILK